jgi:trans-2,3-dihydro-3-hydroxyanthranilate isomerase
VTAFRYVVADVFTDRPLEGNQLAVFTDAREMPEEVLQPLAREINFSETVYVLPAEQGGHARIRIFTPTTELAFAGHPTLGSAFVLAAPLQLDEIRLETKAAIVPVRLERDGDRISFGRMQQPVPSVEPFGDEAALFEALRVEGSALPVETYDNGMTFTYVSLGSEDEVAGVKPDFGDLAELTNGRGVVCFAGEGRRWKARMFAPGSGVAEDPATGSAAGPLAVHLARHGRIGYGDEIEISQGAEVGRPSSLFARADGSATRIESVEVGGSTVVVARGEFRLP